MNLAKRLMLVSHGGLFPNPNPNPNYKQKPKIISAIYENESVDLTWTYDDPVNHFLILRSENPSPHLSGEMVERTKNLFFSDAVIKKKQMYFYCVIAIKGEDDSYISDDVSEEVMVYTASFHHHADTYLELKDSIEDTGLRPKVFTSENLVFENDSAVFDGASSISTDESPDFDFGIGDFTLECAIKVKSGGTIFDLRKVESGQYGNAIVLNKENTWLGLTTGSSWFGVDVDFNDDQFHHIALTRASGITRWFIDGKNIVLGKNDMQFSESRSLCIGKTKANSTEFFNGEIRKVRIFKGIARYTKDFTITDQI